MTQELNPSDKPNLLQLVLLTPQGDIGEIIFHTF